MPYTVITRKVSTSKWYDPRTWWTYRIEWKRVWDMDKPLLPNEIKLFTKDQMHCEWRSTTDFK